MDQHMHCASLKSKEQGVQTIFKELVAENFPNLMKDMYIRHPRSLTNSNIYSKNTHKMHYNKTFKRQRKNLESRKKELTHCIQ